MQSIVLTQPGELTLMETEPPGAPDVDEVQVRVRKVGICGTDLHAFAGKQPFFSYPRVLGHELAVEVIALGPQNTPHDLKVGDHCCVQPYLNCGECGACLRGLENCCTRLQVLGVHRDGGMREIINIPADKLHRSSLPDEQLALVEMLGIGAHAVRRSQIIPGELALVIGVGPIGLGVSQFAHLAGARVMVMDISDSRLAFAAQQRGITACIDAKQDILAQISAISPDELPTVVFDATGSPRSMMDSFHYVAHGGRLVFAGLFQGDVTFHDPEFHRRELTLMASRNATRADFETVLRALETNQIDTAPWVTHHASPEQVVQALPGWLDPSAGVVKAMLTF